MLRIYLAGDVAVEHGERLLPEADLGGRQGRLALVYLVAERERAVTQSELAELLWPDSLPPSWPVALSAVISKLRQRLGTIGLDRDRIIANAFRCYQFRPPPKLMDRSRGRSGCPPPGRGRCAGGSPGGRLRAVADRDHHCPTTVPFGRGRALGDDAP